MRRVTRTSSLTYRPELDGLRALAISAVVAAHLGLFSYGPYGVDFFFVLSGFLITGVLLKLRESKEALKTFWIGRIARLTPILTVNVLVGSILSYFLLRSSFHISQPISALLYVKNFFIANPSNHDVWAPTWTLAAEEQFYLIWPVIIFSITKRLSIKTFIFITLIYFLGVHELLNLMRYLYGHINPLGVVSDNVAGKVVQVVLRPSEILLGALVTLNKRISGPPLVLIFVTTYLLAGSILGINTATLVALLSSVLLSLIDMKGLPMILLNRVLSFKPLVLVGVLSYSIYLWHALIFEVMFAYFGNSLLIKMTIILVTLIVSYLSYVYIEIPIQKFIKSRVASW